MPSTPLGRFRLVALVEGVSFFVLLAVGMPLKYFAGLPEPNYAIGMIHGLLFVSYCVLLMLAARSRRWSFQRIAVAVVVSLVPFGTFAFDPSLRRELAEEAGVPG